MTENELSYKIIGAAIKLHREIGPGLLESAYEMALANELIEEGMQVKCQYSIPFQFKHLKADIGYRIDILVNDLVIIELKTVEELAPVHFAQTLTYLKVAKLKLALLINFNEKVLKNGIHRVVNRL